MTTRPEAAARNGVTVLSAFAFVWAIVGISGLAERPTWWTWLAMAASLGLTVALVRRAGSADQRSPGPPARSFLGVVAVEAGAIVVTVGVLVVLDAPAFIPGAVALVVGVHFFALARVFGASVYHLTGGWLCLVAVVALGVASSDAPAAQAVAGIGSAAGLWATAGVIGRGRRRAVER